MKEYDVVIIGSGLGGLECGYILSKKGYNVCILEKNTQLGGCLQTFRRGKAVFDTGFHFVGGLDEGQFLHALFGYFDLLSLPWHRMDDAFAEVVLDNHSYYLYSGHERFVEKLSEGFPRQEANLRKYTAFLKQVGDTIGDSFRTGGSNAALFEQSAYSWLRETIGDPTLRDVLSGGSLTMELCAGKLPLYIFAQINNSFIQGAWRLKGGGSLIAAKLADSIRRMGGTILTKAEATRLVEHEGTLKYVEYNHEEQIAARYVISDLHPALTLSLIPESSRIRKIYRSRITNLENTFGMFTVHLDVEEGSIPYLNRNIFLYKNNNPWNACMQDVNGIVSSALVSYSLPRDGGNYTSNIDILVPMRWSEVSRWADTRLGGRGADYEAFKRKKAEECISLAAERIPELKGSIKRFYTSTPLTYRDYTGTWNGSAYGIRKDYANILQTLLTPQTPIPNLFLTGQSLNLHGILGVSMTSFFTCEKITGKLKIEN